MNGNQGMQEGQQAWCFLLPGSLSKVSMVQSCALWRLCCCVQLENLDRPVGDSRLHGLPLPGMALMFEDF